MGIDLTTAKVDLARLRRNIEQVRDKLDTGIRLLFAVKGDGYGHGMLEVARLAEGADVDYLGVSDIVEAERLRAARIESPVLIMGPSPREHIADLARLDVNVTVSDLEFARELDRESRTRGIKIPVHINVDTGMGRTGIFPGQAIPFFKEIQSLSHLEIKGVFSHLSSAYIEGPSHREYTLKQMERFNQTLRELEQALLLPPLRHIASTHALVRHEDLVTKGYFNMVRLGELIYGHNISLYRLWNQSLEPAMSITTKIIEIRKVPAGNYIGYGRTYRTSSPREIALLPIGFADGLDLRLSNKGKVSIKGKKAPIVGEICMSQTMIDVTGLENVAVGDEVEVMGPHVHAEEMAQWSNMDLCELLTSFSKMKHIYLR
jgi:alanine racemase